MVIVVETWHPAWAQVESTGAKRCTSSPWQVTHWMFLRAAESDSRWVRCPAVEAMRCHVSRPLPVTWQRAHTCDGTFACRPISCGRSATHR